jgi:hypothetical protein
MDIYDPRSVVDFQKFTFSGHLRSHVYKVLSENIKLGHADYTCYWILELLCSGLVHSMWQTLFESSALHINRAAPNVFLFLVRMYEKFNPYEQQYSVLNMTGIRNNQDVRRLVCEVGASISMCRKNKLTPFPKIKPEHDFQSVTVQENLKSPSSNYSRHLVKDSDPIDLYVSVNELTYCLRPETRDYARSLYWVGWILKYVSQFKKQHKTDLLAAYRSNMYIESKFEKHPIWLIWDVVQDSAKRSPQSGTLAPYIDALYKLHCLRWNPSVLKQRLCFLNTAILFICESTTLDIHYSIPQNVLAVQDVLTNIPHWVSAIIHTQKTFSS